MKTDINIDRIPGGGQLDELIAEHVLGWRWLLNGKVVGNAPRGRWLAHPSIQSALAKGDEPIDEARNRRAVPHYSGIADAAMDVVKQLRANGYDWQIETSAGGGWVATCWKAGRFDDGSFAGRDPSFEVAVCRAAFKAVKHG